MFDLQTWMYGRMKWKKKERKNPKRNFLFCEKDNPDTPEDQLCPAEKSSHTKNEYFSRELISCVITRRKWMHAVQTPQITRFTSNYTPFTVPAVLVESCVCLIWHLTYTYLIRVSILSSEHIFSSPPRYLCSQWWWWWCGLWINWVVFRPEIVSGSLSVYNSDVYTVMYIVLRL